MTYHCAHPKHIFPIVGMHKLNGKRALVTAGAQGIGLGRVEDLS